MRINNISRNFALLGLILCLVVPAQSSDVLESVDVTRGRTRIGPRVHAGGPVALGPRGPRALPPSHAPADLPAGKHPPKIPGEQLGLRVQADLDQVQERFDSLPEESLGERGGNPTIERAGVRLEQAHLAAELEDWPAVKRSVDAARALVTVVEKTELPEDVDIKDDAFAHLERVQALSERAARKVSERDVVLEEARVSRDRGIINIGSEDWADAQSALVHAEGLFRLALRHGADKRPPRRQGAKRRGAGAGRGPDRVSAPPPPRDASEAIARLDDLIAGHGESTSDRTVDLLEKIAEQRDRAKQEFEAGNEEEALRRASQGLRLGFRLAEERPAVGPDRAAEAVGRLDELVRVAEERTADLPDDATEQGLLATATDRLEEARAAIEADDPGSALDAAQVGQDLIFEILSRTRPSIR